MVFNILINYDIIAKQLLLHEGIRLKPYRDTEGKLTIGVGRNLDDVGISEDEAMYMLKNDIDFCIHALENNITFWDKLSDIHKRVLIDMCFQLGIGGLLKFEKMLKAWESGNYKKVARQMKKSRWYKQSKTRAERLIKMVLTDSDYI